MSALAFSPPGKRCTRCGWTITKTYGHPEIIAQNVFRHAVDMVRDQRAAGRIVAVATSSFTEEARRVLNAIGVLDLLQVVVGRDQVSHPKPHPEIYLKTAEALNVTPSECIVIEDSPLSARSALAAEMLLDLLIEELEASG